jgi:hypothetical protein
MAAGVTPGKICVAPGQDGSTTTTTGDTTSGSAVITNVASLDGYGVGIHITATGFSGTVKIISINPTSNSMTVNATAGSSNVGVTLTLVAPTWASLAVLT